MILVAAALIAAAVVSVQERAGTAAILDEIRRTGSLVVDGVQFEDGSGSLGTDAARRLESVLQVFAEHTEWRFEVRVRSADEADVAESRRVLQQRADAVVSWFTRRGIDRDRLVAAERRQPDTADRDRRSDRIEFRKLNEE